MPRRLSSTDAGVDLDNNQKMDWFFNEFVYGTQIPRYKTDYQLEPSGQQNLLKLRVTQSEVSDSFKMPVRSTRNWTTRRSAGLGSSVSTAIHTRTSRFHSLSARAACFCAPTRTFWPTSTAVSSPRRLKLPSVAGAYTVSVLSCYRKVHPQFIGHSSTRLFPRV